MLYASECMPLPLMCLAYVSFPLPLMCPSPLCATPPYVFCPPYVSCPSPYVSCPSPLYASPPTVSVVTALPWWPEGAQVIVIVAQKKPLSITEGKRVGVVMSTGGVALGGVLGPRDVSWYRSVSLPPPPPPLPVIPTMSAQTGLALPTSTEGRSLVGT